MIEQKNIWFIKIYRNNKSFEIMERKTIENKSIGIGYNGMYFDIKDKTNEEIKILMDSLNKTERQQKHIKNVLNNFMNIMKIGDTVFLCKGEYDILYKATISSDYYYDASGGDLKNELNSFWCHRRNISNIEPYQIKSSKRRIQTLYKEVS